MATKKVALKVSARGHETDSEDDQPPKKSRKVKQWDQKFRSEYSKEFPVIQRSARGDQYALCLVCNQHFTVSHGGIGDVKKHVSTKKHKDNAQMQNSMKMETFLVRDDTMSDFDSRVIDAETLFTEFIVEHNLPLSVADHATVVFKKMFPDSKIAEQYSCKRSKTTALVNELSLIKKEGIVDKIRSRPFSVATDGSSDLDLKQYPLVLRYFDDEKGQVVSRVLSVPICESNATGVNIFNLLDSEFKKWGVPYENILALGCDNANVMVGKHKGVYGHFLNKQPNIYCSGCPCHLIHLAAEKAAAKLNAKVDDILIDIFHYLEKSSIRKESLKHYQEFYGKEPRKILKHAGTRWLSLNKCLNRLLDHWNPLKDFFQNEEKLSKPKLKSKSVKTVSSTSNVSTSSKKPVEFKDLFGEPLQKSSDKNPVLHQRVVSESDVKASTSKSDTTSKSSSQTSKTVDSESEYVRKQPEKLERIMKSLFSAEFKLKCLFLKYTIPVFDEINLLLQEDRPLIHQLGDILIGLLRSLLIRFVKPNILKKYKSVMGVNFIDRKCQKEDSELMIGSEAEDYIKTGRLSGEKLKTFYQNVREYFETACKYIQSKFPLDDELLMHAQVCDIQKRDEVKFQSVKYFLNRYPVLLVKCTAVDKIQTEFAEYQCDTSLDIEKLDTNRIDIQWNSLFQKKDHSGNMKYKYLPSVMLGILSIPHSNAECERCFSVIRKNHSEFRSQLGPVAAESIMVLKENEVECFKREHSVSELKRLKKAYKSSLSKN